MLGALEPAGGLDQALTRRGLSLVRYADDVAIYVRSPRSAARIHDRVVRWIEKHLKVEGTP